MAGENYPKWVYKQKQAGNPSAGHDNCLLPSVEAHTSLEEKEPGQWAESPELFDDSGRALPPPVHAVANEHPRPGIDNDLKAYPKWLYRRLANGTVDSRLVETQAQHDAMLDKDSWSESPEMTAAVQADRVDGQPHPGEGLWDTPAPDVIEMLKGANLPTLRRTRDLESQNSGYKGGRKGLMRELDEMIAQAEEAVKE